LEIKVPAQSVEIKIPFKIIVKTNAKQNKVKAFDVNRNAFLVDIKAKARNNEANKEIVKFFSRLLKKRVRILLGLKSKEKVIDLK
jgi:uncharacterized protein (TIGR00251 family)